MFSIATLHTSDGSHEWGGQHQAGAAQVHNAEVLDEDEGDDAFLDVAVGDIEDNAAVGDDTDQQYEDDDCALQGLREYEHCATREVRGWRGCNVNIRASNKSSEKFSQSQRRPSPG